GVVVGGGRADEADPRAPVAILLGTVDRPGAGVDVEVAVAADRGGWWEVAVEEGAAIGAGGAGRALRSDWALRPGGALRAGFALIALRALGTDEVDVGVVRLAIAPDAEAGAVPVELQRGAGIASRALLALWPLGPLGTLRAARAFWASRAGRTCWAGGTLRPGGALGPGFALIALGALGALRADEVDVGEVRVALGAHAQLGAVPLELQAAAVLAVDAVTTGFPLRAGLASWALLALGALLAWWTGWAGLALVTLGAG